MVSLEEVQKQFNRFVKEMIRLKNKKLTPEEKNRIFREIRAFEGLLEEEGFLLEVEKLSAINSHISRKGKIEDRELNFLKEILVKIKEG